MKPYLPTHPGLGLQAKAYTNLNYWWYMAFIVTRFLIDELSNVRNNDCLRRRNYKNDN